jgi:hypothetical protein
MRPKDPLKASIKLRGVGSQRTAISFNAFGISSYHKVLLAPKSPSFVRLLFLANGHVLQEVIQLHTGVKVKGT